MYEDSVCCVGEGNMQFVDQQKWMAHCLVCSNKYCVVCQGQNDEERQSQRLTLALCKCVRCPQCDSANTVNRESTKSYYCHICAKNFCWSCHQQLNFCQCYAGLNIINMNKNSAKRKKMYPPQLKPVVAQDDEQVDQDINFIADE